MKTLLLVTEWHLLGHQSLVILHPPIPSLQVDTEGGVSPSTLTLCPSAFWL